ncbi:hypothetical protein V493_04661 [Pseudogymnoascus sp. VKM F-4281 (FW-2241)]|nr:hypothetical protein V493_04661 [Pseudogymnoascus sp. VKM F-4281 (FW-2241)]
MENCQEHPSSRTVLYKYSYPSLDATEKISLIEILPGQLKDNLRIELHHTVYILLLGSNPKVAYQPAARYAAATTCFGTATTETHLGIIQIPKLTVYCINRRQTIQMPRSIPNTRRSRTWSRGFGSDDTDNVYGMLNLLGPAFEKFIMPDYPAPAAMAYNYLVLAVEQTTGTLNLIRTGSPDFTQDTTSSWTPNLAEFKEVWTGRWKISTGVSRAEM